MFRLPVVRESVPVPEGIVVVVVVAEPVAVPERIGVAPTTEVLRRNKSRRLCILTRR